MPKEHFLFENNTNLHLAALAAKQSRFCLNIIKTILQKLRIDTDRLKETNFLLAVSGGIDSVAMLAVFCAGRQYFGYNLKAVHFHHGIRKESDGEEILFQKLCTRLQIPFEIGRGNTPNYAKEHKIGLEEAGRILRYRFFRETGQKYENCILCTAHHADDLCEDILMRLIRGSAWPQLGGMAYYDESRRLLRPFLYTPKRELIDFVHELHLPYAEDKSNADTNFTRNRIRHSILPLLKAENPKFLESAVKLKLNAEYDQEHFTREVQNVMQFLIKDKEYSLALEHLQKKDKSVRMHCYHYLLKQLGQGHPLNIIFEKLDTAVMQNRGNAVFKFSDNVRMTIRKNRLVCFVKPNV